MKPLTQWLRHAAEGVAAAMLVALFAVFLVQIAARYVFNVPMGWTVEVCLTLWLWIVFWGGAFCLRPADHIRFDVLYLSVNRPTQRIFGAIAAVMIVAAFAVAFLPTFDYVAFYKIKRSNTLGIRLHYVFSIYLLFMLVVILRYSGVLLNFLRGREEVEGKVSAYTRHDEGSIT
ncbi:MAG: TRAP transporter small permease subunit [Rhizobiales bacterium]|jgi:TRAP-type C4-dicarboxylate transport system permease small subunit|nr:TRAP transporter small permease subunit [Hyphomicrobiales bacterium]MBP9174530.1 TRAP transporter small permease subunit [Hyphomicrobiales bacterium]MBZ0259094.1 TRAP transporter small permease subunit [Hyphomicrobiales bacterium]